MWNPPSDFLFQKQSKVFLDKREATVSWQIKKLTRRRLPFHAFECEMKLGTIVRSGFGFDFFAHNAAKVALAEAWERILFTRSRIEKSIHPHFLYSTTGWAAGKNIEHAAYNGAQELWERFLLAAPNRGEHNIKRAVNLNLRNKLLSWVIKNDGDLDYVSLTTRFGHLFLAWVRTDSGWKCDSTYFNEVKDKQKAFRKTLMSLSCNQILVPSCPIEVDWICQPSKKVKPIVETVYQGGALPPVVACRFRDEPFNIPLGKIRQVDCVSKWQKESPSNGSTH